MSSALQYTTHEKLSLRRHPIYNEAWLHDRICDDPTVLGLGDARVLDRERAYTNSGRLDILLFDEDNNRRFEVEVMLGATDPSHIIRCIEYWDVERRRYPGYEHVAVLIAEDITSRFLNVMSLLSGSIPMIAIQLDALRVGQHIILNFVRVLDQTELRVDDTEEESGGGQTSREYWEQKVGKELVHICDESLAMFNAASNKPHELNYLRGYVGLRSSGVVDNVLMFLPKRTKGFVHIWMRIGDTAEWRERFEEAGLPVLRRQGRCRVTLSPADFEQNNDLIRAAVEAAARGLSGVV